MCPEYYRIYPNYHWIYPKYNCICPSYDMICSNYDSFCPKYNFIRSHRILVNQISLLSLVSVYFSVAQKTLPNLLLLSLLRLVRLVRVVTVVTVWYLSCLWTKGIWNILGIYKVNGYHTEISWTKHYVHLLLINKNNTGHHMVSFAYQLFIKEFSAKRHMKCHF